MMLRLAVLFAGLLAVADAATNRLCVIQTPNGTVDLNPIGTQILAINQTINGGPFTPLLWTVNLCAQVDEAPQGATSCNNGSGSNAYPPGFIQEYSTGGTCESVWNSVDQVWQLDNAGYISGAFFNSDAESPWVANVTIGCDPNVPTLAAADYVIVTGTIPQFIFSFTFVSASACASVAPTTTPAPLPTAGPSHSACVIQTPNGTIDLNPIGTQILPMVQVFGTQKSLYEWTVNLCAPVDEAPPGVASSCVNDPNSPQPPGFIQQYGVGECQNVWNAVDQAWSYNSGNVTGTFFDWDDSKPWLATVTIGCDPNAATLANAGDVVVTGTAPNYVFAFNFVSSHVCTPQL